MRVQQIAGALGAELSGINLAAGLDAAGARAIRQALLDHGVVFLRQQPLTPGQFLRFAQAMGEPVDYPFVKGLSDFPQIIEVKKLEHETVNFGGIWHSDTTYLAEPPMGSMLLAKEVPPHGGDTLFACQYAAYSALSPTMQRLLDGLVGLSTSTKADVSRTREDRIQSGGTADARTAYSTAHPVVRTHPETGRKALFVNIAHTAGIQGMTDDESAPLLQFLFAHQVRPEFTCRWRWHTDCLAFWDNRRVLHNPVNDYHGFRRVMQRITLKGDKPV